MVEVGSVNGNITRFNNTAALLKFCNGNVVWRSSFPRSFSHMIRFKCHPALLCCGSPGNIFKKASQIKKYKARAFCEQNKAGCSLYVFFSAGTCGSNRGVVGSESSGCIFLCRTATGVAVAHWWVDALCDSRGQSQARPTQHSPTYSRAFSH